ncbi:MAG: 5'-nucleotidase [Bacteroidia bacterium]
MKNFLLLSLVVALFISCNSVGTVTKTETKQYALGKTTVIDSSTNKTIAPYRDELSLTMDKVIGETDVALEKGQPEGKLGNFVADLALQQGNKNYFPADNKKADFVFLNNGGLRAPLPQGEITVGKVFELLPFENELIVVTLKGTTVNQLINFIIDKGGMPVSNIKITIKDKKAIAVKINGNDFDSTQTYKVITSDYLANGGDNLKMMSDAISKETLGLKLRDAILTQIKELTASGKKITAQKGWRINYEQ